MFGLSDDDKTQADQPHNEHQAPANSQSDDLSSSPFAAAYSSLSSTDDSSNQPAPVARRHQATVPEEDLLQIKSQALQSLAPLVDHLDQSPEEKFKTTMMMIQASDNPELIREAYQAANRIQDEAVRAQALLDVINEINYFTQRGKN